MWFGPASLAGRDFKDAYPAYILQGGRFFRLFSSRREGAVEGEDEDEEDDEAADDDSEGVTFFDLVVGFDGLKIGFEGGLDDDLFALIGFVVLPAFVGGAGKAFEPPLFGSAVVIQLVLRGVRGWLGAVLAVEGVLEELSWVVVKVVVVIDVACKLGGGIGIGAGEGGDQGICDVLDGVVS